MFGACHGVMVMPISSEQCLCSGILTTLGNFHFWRLRYVNLHVLKVVCDSLAIQESNGMCVTYGETEGYVYSTGFPFGV